MGKLLATLRHMYSKSWGGLGTLFTTHYFLILLLGKLKPATGAEEFFSTHKNADVPVVWQCFKQKNASGKASVPLALRLLRRTN